MLPLEIDNAVKLQRDYFYSNETQSYEFRIAQLKKLQQMILDKKDQFAQSLFKDLGRPEFEAYFELVVLYDDIKDTIKHLKKWMHCIYLCMSTVTKNLRSQQWFIFSDSIS